MAQNRQETRALLLMVLMALWLAAYGYSVYYGLRTDPTGDGFTRGLNRVTGFLGWQGVAGILAFACFGVGRSFPKGSDIRRISAVPLGMAVALILGLTAWSIWKMA